MEVSRAFILVAVFALLSSSLPSPLSSSLSFLPSDVVAFPAVAFSFSFSFFFFFFVAVPPPSGFNVSTSEPPPPPPAPYSPIALLQKLAFRLTRPGCLGLESSLGLLGKQKAAVAALLPSKCLPSKGWRGEGDGGNDRGA